MIPFLTMPCIHIGCESSSTQTHNRKRAGDLIQVNYVFCKCVSPNKIQDMLLRFNIIQISIISIHLTKADFSTGTVPQRKFQVVWPQTKLKSSSSYFDCISLRRPNIYMNVFWNVLNKYVTNAPDQRGWCHNLLILLQVIKLRLYSGYILHCTAYIHTYADI